MVVARPDLFQAVVGLETPQCSTVPINGFDFTTPKPQVPVDPTYVSAYATSKIPLLNVNSAVGHKTWAGHAREHCPPLVDAINAAAQSRRTTSNPLTYFLCFWHDSDADQPCLNFSVGGS